jgi:hypothetical protein
LLTDSLGQTVVGSTAWLRWGRGVSHTIWTGTVRGYHADSIHLPYLLDPMFERYGPGARVWLSEVGAPAYEDSVRISSHSWTALDEWQRPEWVDRQADVRVRLRFALLAAGASQPGTELAARLRTLSLRDLTAAAHQVDQICSDSRRGGRLPQATCLAAMAVRSADPSASHVARTMDLVSRHYPVYSWYAAMAAACASADLAETADAAVRWECRSVPQPVRIAEGALV